MKINIEGESKKGVAEGFTLIDPPEVKSNTTGKTYKDLPKKFDPLSKEHLKALYAVIVILAIGTGALLYHPPAPKNKLTQTELVEKLSNENVELMKTRGNLFIKQPQLRFAVKDKQEKLNAAQGAYSGAVNAYDATVLGILEIDSKIEANNERIKEVVNLADNH